MNCGNKVHIQCTFTHRSELVDYSLLKLSHEAELVTKGQSAEVQCIVFSNNNVRYRQAVCQV